MTRWAMVADLRRCVGCQTCTAACKHANATPPGVQWRRVIDLEVGTYPDVQRAFVPVGCQHCDEPACLDVCPTTATRKRADGIVTIDYDLCIGCAYCAVACPYQARYKTDLRAFAYGAEPTENEALRHDDARRSVATKCTFCVERIDAGLEKGQVPGVDPEATPACVNACIAEALAFGDIDDPTSNVSRLLAHNRHFRMHEELGTGPGFFYLWDSNPQAEPGGGDVMKPLSRAAAPGPPKAGGVSAFGPNPWLQASWDWRAAGNFICGGAGGGLIVFTVVSGVAGVAATLLLAAGTGLVGAGLLCVWLEIGRPLRALNVFLHARRSWMSREALVSLPLFALALGAVLGMPATAPAAALAALAFVYCQARIVQGAKGIPAWREPMTVPLLVASGLAEGAGLLLLAIAWSGTVAPALAALFASLLVVRWLLWRAWRARLASTAAPRALAIIDRAGSRLQWLGGVLPLALAALAAVLPADGVPVSIAWALAGLLAAGSGAAFKFVLITRAAFNQGFTLTRLPVRGVPR